MSHRSESAAVVARVIRAADRRLCVVVMMGALAFAVQPVVLTTPTNALDSRPAASTVSRLQGGPALTVARHAATTVNQGQRAAARRWTTTSAARRMFDLRAQGFRFRDVRNCRQLGRQPGLFCATFLRYRGSTGGTSANLHVRRVPGRGLRVTEVSGLD